MDGTTRRIAWQEEMWLGSEHGDYRIVAVMRNDGSHDIYFEKRGTDAMGDYVWLPMDDDSSRSLRLCVFEKFITEHCKAKAG